MRLRTFSVSFSAAAVVIALSAVSAAAGGCLKDTRQTKVDQANVVRLLDYLCTSDVDAKTRVRVQFQRLSGFTPGVVLNGGSAPWRSALYGNYQVADNDVFKEYKTLMSRFGFAVREVDQGHLGLLAGTAHQLASGEPLEEVRATSGQIVRSFKLSPLPDIPLVEETLHILNEETWPASLNMDYGIPATEDESLDAVWVWRYLTAADVSQYAERLQRYNALVIDGKNDARKALPKSMELLNYLTANGWPENFLYASTIIFDACGERIDFKVHQYSFEIEVAVIENVSAKPITISQLFGQEGGSNQLRRAGSSASTTGKQALPGEPVTLAPSSRLIVPLRLVFAAEDASSVDNDASKAEARIQAEKRFGKIMATPRGTAFTAQTLPLLRGNATGDEITIHKLRESFKPPKSPVKYDFGFGPEWALAGFTTGGDTIAFEATPPNVIMITARNEGGSCPILYAWDAGSAIWIRHGKVLHEAHTRMHAASETVQFDGLVHRFRLAEEELERATIRPLSLKLELNDGRTLTLPPEAQPEGQVAQPQAELVAELYANDEIEITFVLPADLDAAQVIRSSLTVSGYYERYTTLLLSAAARRNGNIQARDPSP